MGKELNSTEPLSHNFSLKNRVNHQRYNASLTDIEQVPTTFFTHRSTFEDDKKTVGPQCYNISNLIGKEKI